MKKIKIKKKKWKKNLVSCFLFKETGQSVGVGSVSEGALIPLLDPALLLAPVWAPLLPPRPGAPQWLIGTDSVWSHHLK